MKHRQSKALQKISVTQICLVIQLCHILKNKVFKCNKEVKTILERLIRRSRCEKINLTITALKHSCRRHSRRYNRNNNSHTPSLHHYHVHIFY